jgi:hypothetical protein
MMSEEGNRDPPGAPPVGPTHGSDPLSEAEEDLRRCADEIAEARRIQRLARRLDPLVSVSRWKPWKRKGREKKPR